MNENYLVVSVGGRGHLGTIVCWGLKRTVTYLLQLNMHLRAKYANKALTTCPGLFAETNRVSLSRDHLKFIVLMLTI